MPAKATKTVHVGARVPQRAANLAAQDPDHYYVLVEKDNAKVPEYDSPYDSMIDDRGFVEVSDDKKDTGHSRLVLMKQPRELHNAEMAEAINTGNDRITADDNVTPANLRDGRSEAAFDSSKRGAALALEDLTATAGKDTVG